MLLNGPWRSHRTVSKSVFYQMGTFLNVVQFDFHQKMALLGIVYNLLDPRKPRISKRLVKDKSIRKKKEES